MLKRQRTEKTPLFSLLCKGLRIETTVILLKKTQLQIKNLGLRIFQIYEKSFQLRDIPKFAQNPFSSAKHSEKKELI